MATTAYPDQRPNVATAAVRFPAVRDYEQVDSEIAGTLRPTLGWFAALGIAILCLLIGATAWTYQIHEGLGAAGYQPPVMWGVYIVTFVFWVGIGHAGTLISAILYLFRAGFRTSIYRVSEAMTVFAVMTAGLFPILHLGRPWKFFYLIPYPNWRLIWPNPKSPLVWDVFAILTYLTISSTFLYIGLIPDIAILRDREKNPVRKSILAMLSLGWRNSDREWRHFTRAYLFLARVRDTARALRALRRVLRLCDGADARLARDDLPAVFRRRRDLLGHRHGVHHCDPAAQGIQASALHHAQRHRCGGQALPLYVDGGRPRLPDGIPGGVDERQQVRAGLLLEPRVRAVGMGRWIMLICTGAPAFAVLAELRATSTWLFILSLFINLWDVVRAFRHRRAVPVA